MIELNNDVKLERLERTYVDGRVTLHFLSGFDNQVIINNSINQNKSIIVDEFADVEIIEFVTEKSEENSILIEVEVHGKLRYHQVFLSEIKNNNINVLTKVYDGGSYVESLIDLNKGNSKVDIESNVLDEGGLVEIYTACLSGEKQVKNIEVNSINFAAHTECHMTNFGIGYDEGKVHVTGIGDIRNGAHGSTNKQKSTMIVFDELAKATNKPLLLIEEDDVVANHASAVGKIDEQTIFYLCSRGLTLKQAKKYISLGYFKPVLNVINDINTKDKVLNYLEEVIKDD